MRKLLLVCIALSAMFEGTVALADTCESWGHRAYPVTMQACSYPSGGSGYAIITNDGARPASICWTVVANNGREFEGCATLDSGASSTPSCASCGSNNGGARHILLRSYSEK